MQVKALKAFSSTTYGNISQGQVLDIAGGLAKQFNASGLTAPFEYETKVIREVPTVPGETQPSSSSPAGQAPTKKTRGRRGKAARS